MPAQHDHCSSLHSFTGVLPKLLHQAWHAPKAEPTTAKEHAVPRQLAPLVSQWGANLKPFQWTLHMWNSADARELWRSRMPRLLGLFDQYQLAVQRADASRLLLMHIFGGIYADLDVAPCIEFTRSLEALNRSTSGTTLKLLLVREPRFGVSNFFVGSAPGHPFWRYAMRRLRASSKESDPVHSTGPQFFHAAWSRYDAEVTAEGCADVLHNATAIISLDAFQTSFAAHHWSGTWHDPTNAVAQHDPSLLLWLGVNHSETCPEARFGDVIATRWRCLNKGSACPKATCKCGARSS